MDVMVMADAYALHELAHACGGLVTNEFSAQSACAIYMTVPPRSIPPAIDR